MSRGLWADEIPDALPLPELEHVYVYMLLKLGRPNLSWMNSSHYMKPILDIRDDFGLSCSSRSLLMQYEQWYEEQGLTSE